MQKRNKTFNGHSNSIKYYFQQISSSHFYQKQFRKNMTYKNYGKNIMLYKGGGTIKEPRWDRPYTSIRDFSIHKV